MMIHEMKIDPIHFLSLVEGSKTFEIRKDDRPFSIGDVIELREYDREVVKYTGNKLSATIKGIFGRTEDEAMYVIDGYVILSIRIDYIKND